MEAGLLGTLQRTSSIQGLLGQHLSSSQLSFSSSLGPSPLAGSERFCAGGFLDGPAQRVGPRSALGLGLALGSGLHYESHFGKWSLSAKKGFNGPAAELEGQLLVRTQVRTHSALSTTSISALILGFLFFTVCTFKRSIEKSPLQCWQTFVLICVPV